MRILVLQPHADDAVWSIAEHMLTWLEDGHQVEVFTTHGGKVPGQEAKHTTLRKEHRSVMQKMGCEDFYCQSFFDDAWDERPAASAWAGEVADLIFEQTSKPDVLVGPVGAHHPDHQVIAWVTHALERRWLTYAWWYEELPYYVLYPADRKPLGRRVELQGHNDHFTEKKELCRMYRSQWAPHLERTVFAPERLWVPT